MKLHLGSGANVMAGWENLDMDSQGADVKPWHASEGLGYEAGSIEAIYSEHMIEHLPVDLGAALLRECFRVLAPGGVLRVSTPDLQTLMKVYAENKLGFYGAVGFVDSTRCRLFNRGVREWGHLFIYDDEELVQSLCAAGFQPPNISLQPWRQSAFEVFRGIESRPNCGDLIVEAQK